MKALRDLQKLPKQNTSDSELAFSSGSCGSGSCNTKIC
jgi:lipoprotein